MKPELALKPHNGPILSEKNSPERTLAQKKKKKNDTRNVSVFTLSECTASAELLPVFCCVEF